ncbi:hypothetical protein [Thalassobacillus sp. C254]|uniref:hypothetical protein n=1 Tax=Thalassobacillus sp. C254 TaxID=1225341 RepID=UPI0006CF4A45|nr:hypothetical protein [Thalassobacillus sp. C254]
MVNHNYSNNNQSKQDQQNQQNLQNQQNQQNQQPNHQNGGQGFANTVKNGLTSCLMQHKTLSKQLKTFNRRKVLHQWQEQAQKSLWLN